MNKRIDIEFDSSIWKMIPDYFSSLMLFELRHQENQTVEYSVLNLNNGNQIIDGLHFEDGWWTQAYAIVGDIIIFQFFEEENDPSQYRIFAYTIENNEVLWEREDFYILSFDRSIIQGKCGKDRSTDTTLNLRNGEKVLSRKAVQRDIPGITYPTVFLQESDKFSSIMKYIQQSVGQNPIQKIDYLEYHNHLIIGFYTLNPSHKLSSYILISDHNGQIVEFERLNDDLTGIADFTFSIWQNIVIFVKDRRCLLCYEI